MYQFKEAFSTESERGSNPGPLSRSPALCPLSRLCRLLQALYDVAPRPRMVGISEMRHHESIGVVVISLMCGTAPLRIARSWASELVESNAVFFITDHEGSPNIVTKKKGPAVSATDCLWGDAVSKISTYAGRFQLHQYAALQAVVTKAPSGIEPPRLHVLHDLHVRYPRDPVAHSLLLQCPRGLQYAACLLSEGLLYIGMLRRFQWTLAAEDDVFVDVPTLLEATSGIPRMSM